MRHPEEVDPLYLFACHLEWETNEEPRAGWELIAAARSSDEATRSHARTLLSGSRHLPGIGLCETSIPRKRAIRVEEADMKAPYGIEIIENCCECPHIGQGHFCHFSSEARDPLSKTSHKSVLPAGAILFVEGQAPRGVFIICSGKVNLSTTSREGKLLILRTAGPGEALGLSATVSGVSYETTAETATPCHVNFVDRKHFLELMQDHPEIGLQTAQCLSRDYQFAYRDIHDLVLTRSSAGKLARLLLSQVQAVEDPIADCKPTPMTHEEMAMRIGASRETVTRLISRLRRKRLIRLDGPMLVIKDRTALEALAV
jgi:CRP/FNR family transcriptional regulator, cyclic AMP receptor protein